MLARLSPGIRVVLRGAVAPDIDKQGNQVSNVVLVGNGSFSVFVSGVDEDFKVVNEVLDLFDSFGRYSFHIIH